jgi:hypothetical protein
MGMRNDGICATICKVRIGIWDSGYRVLFGDCRLHEIQETCRSAKVVLKVRRTYFVLLGRPDAT